MFVEMYLLVLLDKPLLKVFYLIKEISAGLLGVLIALFEEGLLFLKVFLQVVWLDVLFVSHLKLLDVLLY